MDFDSWVKSALSFDPADAAQPKSDAGTPPAKGKAKTVSDTTATVTAASAEKLAKLPSADQVKRQALFANGKPTGDARKAQIKLYKAMHLDPAFKTREQKRGLGAPTAPSGPPPESPWRLPPPCWPSIPPPPTSSGRCCSSSP